MALLALFGFTLFGVDLTELLAAIDWSQAFALLLAAIGGGGVMNVAGKTGWFAGLVERFRGKAASVQAAAAAVTAPEASAEGRAPGHPLENGFRALRSLDELLRERGRTPEERRKRFMDGIADLLD